MQAIADALALLEQKIRAGLPVPLSVGFIARNENAIRYVARQGLYSRVVLSGGVWDGETCDAAVGGALFFATARGRFHSEPIAPGEAVLVALVEGDPAGAAVIVSRYSTTDAAADPEEEVGFRPVHEVNLSNHHVDRMTPGADVYVDLVRGSYFMRLQEVGDYTIRAPDGTVVNLLQDDANGGWSAKLKHATGACVLVSGAGVRITSPDGESYLQVDNAGVAVRTPGRFKTEAGLVFLNVRETDAALLPTAMCAYRGPLVPTPLVTAPSATVFIGN